MKNKRSYLKERGITLIALVVTIVVLLILAGVTINAVFSDSGIIKKAQNTQNKANEAVQKDMEKIKNLEEKLGNIVDQPYEKYENETLYYNGVAFDGYLIYLITPNTFNLKQSKKDSNLYYCLKEDFTGDITKPSVGYVVSIYKSGKTYFGLNIFDNKMYFNSTVFSGAYILKGDVDYKYSMGICCYNIFSNDGMEEFKEQYIQADKGIVMNGGNGAKLKTWNESHYLDINGKANEVYYMENGIPYTGTFSSYNGNGTATNGVSQDTFSLVACLTPNTEIYVIEEDEKKKKKRIKKKIKDIKVGDKVVSINPITGEQEEDTVILADGDENKKYKEYDVWKFEDGTVIETVKRHRFYNIEKQDFKYMDEWDIGDSGYNYNGEKIKLIAHEKIEEEIQHCTIFTEKWNNYFANGMLSGNRNSAKIKL